MSEPPWLVACAAGMLSGAVAIPLTRGRIEVGVGRLLHPPLVLVIAVDVRPIAWKVVPSPLLVKWSEGMSAGPTEQGKVAARIGAANRPAASVRLISTMNIQPMARTAPERSDLWLLSGPRRRAGLKIRRINPDNEQASDLSKSTRKIGNVTDLGPC